LGIALALLALLIVLVAVGAYRLFAPAGSPIILPDFSGTSMDAAQSTASHFGVTLRVVADHNDDKVAKGDVLGQFPAAGEHVRQGRIIDVIVSDGPTLSDVPDLGNLSLRDAQIALGNARLDLGTVTRQKSDLVSEGRVLSQTPVALTQAPAGTKVDVTVAQGKPEAYVPNFVGLSIEFSSSAAKQAGVSLGPPLWLPIAKNAKPRGVVIAQDPLPGQPMDAGAKVILHVSGGAPPTPTPLPTEAPTQAPIITTPLPSAASPSASTNPQASPSAEPPARSMRIQVALPALTTAKRVRVALVDAGGSHDLYDQTTKGGFTLQFDVTVTGAGTVQTYIDGVLSTTNGL
jgi:beta-lactam-binding protein with PASTA domain